jgi:cytochrome c peroxidase
MVKWMLLFGACFILFISFIGIDEHHVIKTKAQLGEKLFNEKILSIDSTISCASCHKPAFAFADTTTLSLGVHNTLTTRNTPSVLNMLNRSVFFYDGRANTLEQQALMPIEHKDEMGLPITAAIERLNKNIYYKNLFLKIFKQKPNANNLGKAISAYERTLETIDSKFDDWTNEDTTKWTKSEERGRQLFIGEKAKCFNCHSTEDFTNDDFKNIGIYNNKNFADKGRYNITKKETDIGKFKTPGLRNVAVTAPYMHNGHFKTLEEVVDYYNEPQKYIANSINIDADLKSPLGLTNQEKSDLVAFLKTLTDKKYKKLL